jgi:16S rRNA (cytidine1402-2'-O)-methyltransferase
MNNSEPVNTHNPINSTGSIFLIPVNIADSFTGIFIPEFNMDVIRRLKFFIVENQRTARRFISRLKLNIDIPSLEFETIEQETSEEVLNEIIRKILDGKDAGILSESGNPGIADPGSKIIALAHKNDIKIHPLVGPSSVLLGLISSGFNGQNFAFHGYLPIKEKELEQRIREIEKRMKIEDQTQIFIETPYRNEKLAQSLLNFLQPETLLCIAADLTGPGEMIKMMPVKQWKSQNINLKNIPAIFLIYHQ